MKKTLGVNASWKEMMFDICAMLKYRPRETQDAYNFVYALTGGNTSADVGYITITGIDFRMSPMILNNITDEELLQLQLVCKNITERIERRCPLTDHKD